MSPEVARTRARSAQVIAASALVLAALSVLFSVVLFAGLQKSRTAVTHHVCGALGELIVKGAESSKPFEPLIRRNAPEAPRYEVRVKRARKDARVLCLKIKRDTRSPGL